MNPAVEFWSSVEFGGFQRALQRELVSRGWAATSRHGVAQSRYWGARTRLARLHLRLAAYALYPAQVAWRSARAPRNSVAVVTSNTFFAPRLSQTLGIRPVVHWVFDLYPDVLSASGVVRAGGIVDRSLGWLMRRTFDDAAANVFLGERLRRHAEDRFGAIPRAHVIPVGADGGGFHAPPEPRNRPPRILYAGNLGRMHDVETVKAALHTGVKGEIEFAFRGNGAGFREIEEARGQFGPGVRVTFGGNLPDAEWQIEMRAADVGLVTLRPGAEALVMPSKTYSALAAGQAILAVCNDDSDLAALVRQHDAGWVIRPGDSEALRRALEHLTHNPSELLAKRRNAWRAAHACYTQDVLAGQWADLLAIVARVVA